MTDYIFWQTLGLLGGLVYSSFFEWTLHKHIMHTNVKWFSYPFKAHAITHHQTFKADETYHIQDNKHLSTVPMAWWNGPAMWLLHVPPILLVQYFVGRPIFWGVLLALVIYYCVYEYLHWCMHVPRKRNLERSGIFFRINGHHLLHHRYMGKNLNVILPLADLVLGTLLLRSPIRFAQAQGEAVPNVQPDPNESKSMDDDDAVMQPLSER